MELLCQLALKARVREKSLEHGINHIGVAASCGDAELRIATWLRAAAGLGHQDR